MRGSDITAAVRDVGSGRSMLDHRAAAVLMAKLRTPPPAPDPTGGLTDSEHTVLELIGEGLTNRQIGERLFFAEKTVKNHVTRILAKLGMERRTQAAVLVAQV